MTINTLLDTYESIVDYARAYSEGIDTLRWELGDCANLVMNKWDDKTVEGFAADIGQHKATVYQYAKVARFYEPSLRRRLLEDMRNINYSHMRDALRLGNLEAAQEWLEEVSSNGWTADESSRRLTERLGRQPSASVEGVIQYTQHEGLHVFIHLNHSGNWQAGQVVTLRIKS